MSNIYLDYNATTPLDVDVIEVIHNELKNSWGNPSSNYSIGQSAKKVIEIARVRVAQMLRTEPSNIIFTSGGTESSNIAITSAIKHSMEIGKEYVPHVITSSVEHDATLRILEHLSEKSEIDVSLVKPINGQIITTSVLEHINDRTCLISIMMANNETGVLFPVSEIGKQLEIINEQRKRDGLGIVLLHTDAAQVIGKIALFADEVKADYITIAGHKFYGPKIGCLYFKKDVPLYAMLFGGGQENGLRPGTENTPMIAGLGEAAKLVSENVLNYNEHMQNLRDLLQRQLLEKFPKDELVLNFIDCDRLPNTLSLSFLHRNARNLLSECQHVMASTGSACHSSNIETSRVIKECLDKKLWNGTIRLSVGRETTDSEIISAVEDIFNAFINTAIKLHT